MLFEKLKALPREQRAAVEDFVDFLIAKTSKHVALDRLLPSPQHCKPQVLSP